MSARRGLDMTITVKPSAVLEPGAERRDDADPGWSSVRLGTNVVHGESTSRTAIVAGGACLFTAWRGRRTILHDAELYGQHGNRLRRVQG